MLKRYCLHRMQTSPPPQQKAWVTDRSGEPPEKPTSVSRLRKRHPRRHWSKAQSLLLTHHPLPTPASLLSHPSGHCTRLSLGLWFASGWFGCPPSLLGPGLSFRGERPLEEGGGGRTQPQQPGQAEPPFGKVHRPESFPCPPSQGAGRLTHRGRQPEPPATVLPSPRSSRGPRVNRGSHTLRGPAR